MKCADCKFFEKYTANIAESPNNGECHRYPPKLNVGNGGGFPVVRLDEWCGEFQPRQDKP